MLRLLRLLKAPKARGEAAKDYVSTCCFLFHALERGCLVIPRYAYSLVLGGLISTIRTMAPSSFLNIQGQQGCQWIAKGNSGRCDQYELKDRITPHVNFFQ